MELGRPKSTRLKNSARTYGARAVTTGATRSGVAWTGFSVCEPPEPTLAWPRAWVHHLRTTPMSPPKPTPPNLHPATGGTWRRQVPLHTPSESPLVRAYVGTASQPGPSPASRPHARCGAWSASTCVAARSQRGRRHLQLRELTEPWTVRDRPSGEPSHPETGSQTEQRPWGRSSASRRRGTILGPMRVRPRRERRRDP